MLKKHINLYCPYCKKVCDKDTDEWVFHKRGTKQYFHAKCLLEECRKNDRDK